VIMTTGDISVSKPMFALVDMNNFYVSCERAFNPNLEYQPVVVLSNNDGCAVVRSKETRRVWITRTLRDTEIMTLAGM